jgi:hypothetical protein
MLSAFVNSINPLTQPTHPLLLHLVTAVQFQIKECEFQSDGRCYIAAKLVSRCRISEHFVEDATQGLHYCQVRPLNLTTLSLNTELFFKALSLLSAALYTECLR